MAKLRMAHASTPVAHKPPGPKFAYVFYLLSLWLNHLRTDIVYWYDKSLRYGGHLPISKNIILLFTLSFLSEPWTLSFNILHLFQMSSQHSIMVMLIIITMLYKFLRLWKKFTKSIFFNFTLKQSNKVWWLGMDQDPKEAKVDATSEHSMCLFYQSLNWTHALDLLEIITIWQLSFRSSVYQNTARTIKLNQLWVFSTMQRIFHLWCLHDASQDQSLPSCLLLSRCQLSQMPVAKLQNWRDQSHGATRWRRKVSFLTLPIRYSLQIF